MHRSAPWPACGEGFVAGDREQPRRDRSARLEGSGLPPNGEEHLAEQIFGKGLFVDEAEKPPVNGDAMAPAAIRLIRASSEEFSRAAACAREAAARPGWVEAILMAIPYDHVPPNNGVPAKAFPAFSTNLLIMRLLRFGHSR
jgi:hypothetical protein